ncbi:uncharacterized protein LOC127102061 [Lathyrus oleraceus]|uniref:uncharacterized protein LOC127102061 n=1 Tax=Pisum sativum TaxID=3888 RepID=UPI0021CEED28|nr:uncharacterized protein LOC127102061 [Pisum sativum]
MTDWGPMVIAVVLFVILCPGLLFQIQGKGRIIEFVNMQTSRAFILVHTIIYFGLIIILLVAIGVHIFTAGERGSISIFNSLLNYCIIFIV